MRKFMKKAIMFVVMSLIVMVGFTQTPPHVVSGNQIEVYYGGWSLENSWDIVHLKNVEDTIQSGGPLPVNYTFSYNGVQGMWPGEYEFRAYDSYGDGWIGPNGTGWFCITPSIGIGTDTIYFENPSGLLLTDYKLVVPFTVYSNDTLDVGIIGDILPGDGVLTSNEYVTVEIKNYGTDSLLPGDVNITMYSYYHQQYYYQPNATALGTGDSEVITFSTPLDLSVAGEYTLMIDADVVGDEYENNNIKLHQFVNKSFRTIPWSENFSGSVAQWDGWTANGSTYVNSPQSWLSYNYQCARANFFYTPYGTMNMTTPSILLDAPAVLTFDWSSMYAPLYLTDSLDVMVSIDYGLTWESVWKKGGIELSSETLAGNVEPGGFKTETVDLFDYTGENVYIKFKAIAGYGPDLFIDNVGVDYRCDEDLVLEDFYLNEECGDPTGLKFVIKNNGNMVVDSFLITYTWNNTTLTEIRNDVLVPSTTPYILSTNNTLIFPTNYLDVDVEIIIPDHNGNQKDDNPNDNTMTKTLEITDVINTFPFIENFEGGDSDYFKGTTGSHAQIYTTQATNPTFYGNNHGSFLIMTGSDVTNGVQVWPGNSYELTHGEHQHYAEYSTCPIDASGLSSLEIVFDFKQFMKWHDYYTWFTLLVDGTPIADVNGIIDFNPATEYGDAIIEMKYDLTPYVNTPFVLTFQTINKYGMNTMYAPGCGSMIDNIIIREIPQTVQTLQLKQNWNIMSTYVEPQAPNIADVFEPLDGELVMVKDKVGNVYWPWFGYNGIGNINNNDGYQVKMSANAELDIYGDSIIPELTPINVNAGWSLVSYIRNNPAAVEPIFGGNSNIVLIADDDGNPFWPMFGVNILDEMKDGEGYKFCTSGSFNFTYPANNDTIIGTSTKSIRLEQQHYDRVERSGEAMYVAIVSDNIQMGDEVAAYSSTGNMIGSAIAQKDGVAIVTIWGNEQRLNEYKNANTGENYTIELFKSRKSKTYKLTNMVFETGSDRFENNTYAIIKDFEIPTYFENELAQNYPNPVVSSTMIEFTLATDGFVTIDLYDANNKFIRTIISNTYNMGSNQERVDLSDIESGNYYYIMRVGDDALTKLLTKI